MSNYKGGQTPLVNWMKDLKKRAAAALNEQKEKEVSFKRELELEKDKMEASNRFEGELSNFQNFERIGKFLDNQPPVESRIIHDIDNEKQSKGDISASEEEQHLGSNLSEEDDELVNQPQVEKPINNDIESINSMSSEEPGEILDTDQNIEYNENNYNNQAEIDYLEEIESNETDSRDEDENTYEESEYSDDQNNRSLVGSKKDNSGKQFNYETYREFMKVDPNRRPDFNEDIKDASSSSISDSCQVILLSSDNEERAEEDGNIQNYSYEKQVEYSDNDKIKGSNEEESVEGVEHEETLPQNSESPESTVSGMDLKSEAQDYHNNNNNNARMGDNLMSRFKGPCYNNEMYIQHDDYQERPDQNEIHRYQEEDDNNISGEDAAYSEVEEDEYSQYSSREESSDGSNESDSVDKHTIYSSLNETATEEFHTANSILVDHIEQKNNDQEAYAQRSKSDITDHIVLAQAAIASNEHWVDEAEDIAEEVDFTKQLDYHPTVSHEMKDTNITNSQRKVETSKPLVSGIFGSIDPFEFSDTFSRAPTSDVDTDSRNITNDIAPVYDDIQLNTESHFMDHKDKSTLTNNGETDKTIIARKDNESINETTQVAKEYNKEAQLEKSAALQKQKESNIVLNNSEEHDFNDNMQIDPEIFSANKIAPAENDQIDNIEITTLSANDQVIDVPVRISYNDSLNNNEYSSTNEMPGTEMDIDSKDTSDVEESSNDEASILSKDETTEQFVTAILDDVYADPRQDEKQKSVDPSYVKYPNLLNYEETEDITEEENKVDSNSDTTIKASGHKVIVNDDVESHKSIFLETFEKGEKKKGAIALPKLANKDNSKNTKLTFEGQLVENVSDEATHLNATDVKYKVDAGIHGAFSEMFDSEKLDIEEKPFSKSQNETRQSSYNEEFQKLNPTSGKAKGIELIQPTAITSISDEDKSIKDVRNNNKYNLEVNIKDLTQEVDLRSSKLASKNVIGHHVTIESIADADIRNYNEQDEERDMSEIDKQKKLSAKQEHSLLKEKYAYGNCHEDTIQLDIGVEKPFISAAEDRTFPEADNEMVGRSFSEMPSLESRIEVLNESLIGSPIIEEPQSDSEETKPFGNIVIEEIEEEISSFFNPNSMQDDIIIDSEPPMEPLKLFEGFVEELNQSSVTTPIIEEFEERRSMDSDSIPLIIDSEEISGTSSKKRSFEKVEGNETDYNSLRKRAKKFLSSFSFLSSGFTSDEPEDIIEVNVSSYSNMNSVDEDSASQEYDNDSELNKITDDDSFSADNGNNLSVNDSIQDMSKCYKESTEEKDNSIIGFESDTGQLNAPTYGIKPDNLISSPIVAGQCDRDKNICEKDDEKSTFNIFKVLSMKHADANSSSSVKRISPWFTKLFPSNNVDQLERMNDIIFTNAAENTIMKDAKQEDNEFRDRVYCDQSNQEIDASLGRSDSTKFMPKNDISDGSRNEDLEIRINEQINCTKKVGIEEETHTECSGGPAEVTSTLGTALLNEIEGDIAVERADTQEYSDANNVFKRVTEDIQSSDVSMNVKDGYGIVSQDDEDLNKGAGFLNRKEITEIHNDSDIESDVVFPYNENIADDNIDEIQDVNLLEKAVAVNHANIEGDESFTKLPSRIDNILNWFGFSRTQDTAAASNLNEDESASDSSLSSHISNAKYGSDSVYINFEDEILEDEIMKGNSKVKNEAIALGPEDIAEESYLNPIDNEVLKEPFAKDKVGFNNNDMEGKTPNNVENIDPEIHTVTNPLDIIDIKLTTDNTNTDLDTGAVNIKISYDEMENTKTSNIAVETLGKSRVDHVSEKDMKSDSDDNLDSTNESNSIETLDIPIDINTCPTQDIFVESLYKGKEDTFANNEGPHIDKQSSFSGDDKSAVDNKVSVDVGASIPAKVTNNEEISKLLTGNQENDDMTIQVSTRNRVEKGINKKTDLDVTKVFDEDAVDTSVLKTYTENPNIDIKSKATLKYIPDLNKTTIESPKSEEIAAKTSLRRSPRRSPRKFQRGNEQSDLAESSDFTNIELKFKQEEISGIRTRHVTRSQSKKSAIVFPMESPRRKRKLKIDDESKKESKIAKKSEKVDANAHIGMITRSGRRIGSSKEEEDRENQLIEDIANGKVKTSANTKEVVIEALEDIQDDAHFETFGKSKQDASIATKPEDTNISVGSVRGREKGRRRGRRGRSRGRGGSRGRGRGRKN